jgi:hypothetical protein
MKTTTMRTMIAAATLMVAAGVASAQSYRAEIPMAFRMGDKVMTPGSYEIRVTNSGSGERIVAYNLTSYAAAALGSAVKSDAPKQWRDAGAPKIAFECVDGACSLRKLWDGFAPYVLNVPAHKPAGELMAHRAEVVTLTMVKAH